MDTATTSNWVADSNLAKAGGRQAERLQGSFDSRKYFTRLPNGSTTGADITSLLSTAAITFRTVQFAERQHHHAPVAASMSATGTNFSLGLPGND